MRVKSITLSGFRNYGHETVSFDDDINIITGSNAQGKTNLLEAIYLLTGGKSFRTRYDREMIGFSVNEAEISGVAEASGRMHQISVRLVGGRKKQIRQNGVSKTASELSNALTAVLFCPEDLNMISDGAHVRRKLLDVAVSRLKPVYADLTAKYARIYEHKTRILRDFREKPSLLKALDEFSDGICRYSSLIIGYRAEYVRLLKEKAARIHSEVSGTPEKLEIRYRTIGTAEDPTAPADELYECLRDHMRAHREAELRCGMCLTGIHKDDLDITVNGKEARIYASRGQARTAAISIKMAEREICKDAAGEYPILLLDDVLSELDSSRREYVLSGTSEGQTFITCCEGESPAKRTGGKIIEVKNGVIIDGEKRKADVSAFGEKRGGRA
ncbi:MAG: DNA replication/repair protein RecF [Oscillospiraceae bacterium]|nr:DNA replication/repair protein RecF [Oscillospiraceae bacterium]